MNEPGTSPVPVSASARTLVHPAQFGLAALFVWWQWFMGTIEILAPDLIAWCPRPLTGLQGSAMLLMAVALALTKTHRLPGKWSDMAAIACLMAPTAIICCGSITPWGSMLALIALPLASIGIAWSYMRWAALYCRMGQPAVFVSAFGSFILAAMAKIILASLSTLAAAIVAALLPILIFQSAWYQEENLPRETSPTSATARPRRSCIAKILACVTSFSLIEAVIPTILGLRVSEFAESHFVISQVVAAALAAVILLWLFARQESGFGWAWHCLLLWIGVLLFLVTFGSHPGLYSSVLYGSFSTIWLFLWVILIDISRYSPTPRIVFVGLGSALLWIPYSAISIITTKFATGSLTPEVSFIVFLALVSIMFVCTDTRDPDIRIVLSPLGDRQWYPQDWVSIDERCEEMAARYDLTKREQEVMVYLAKGRSRTYIAETLFVSENTVKAHIKHLYAKLGIKSRQELQDFLDMG